MTAPKLVTNPPEGSGLISNLVERDYQDLVRGKPAELRVARVMLQAVGQASRKTKDGVKTTVVYEIVRLEPCHDQHDADTVTWEIGRSYESRTSGNAQEMLPMSGPSDQRDRLIDALFEWASEQDVPQSELDQRWTDYFGGREHASSETVRTGALVQLMEFARYVGAIEDPTVGASADDEDEPTDPDEDLDPPAEQTAVEEQVATDEPAPGVAAALRSVPFQTGDSS